MFVNIHIKFSFNTQPPEGGCRHFDRPCHGYRVSTLSRPKAAAVSVGADRVRQVSTLSRPKAAGSPRSNGQARTCFNTQPPEGGCSSPSTPLVIDDVSTLSRPKAAGLKMGICMIEQMVSTLSRPKAAVPHIMR